MTPPKRRKRVSATHDQSAKVKLVCDAFGLDRGDLAVAIGVSLPTVYRLCAGRKMAAGASRTLLNGLYDLAKGGAKGGEYVRNRLLLGPGRWTFEAIQCLCSLRYMFAPSPEATDTDKDP